MDTKNKSNIKLLSIVASVVLLIIVLGASFAYFGTYKENIDKYKINITIDEFAKATFVTKDANLNLSVSKKDMVAYEAGTKASENSANLNVVLTSGNPNVKVTCTYDIYYEYDANSSIYGVSPTPVTDSSLKELTLKAVGSTGTNNYADEKNFNYDTNWTQNPYKRLIVKGASITDATKNGTTDTWNFNMAFYNLDADQNKLAGKTFAGSFYVDKDSIQCDYEENKSLYNEIEKRYNEDKTYLGLYNGEGADTYANPVYYYKGNVENNNVLFGGFCWKIVRTTETGGVKIVYNGKPFDVVETSQIDQSSYANVSNDATYPYTFDSTSKTWVSTNKTDGKTGTITFTVATAGDYYLSYVMSSESGWDKAKFYKNGTALGDSNGYSGTVSGTIALTGLTTSDEIKVEYTKDSSGASGSDTVTFSIGKAVGDPVKSCNNTGTDSQIGTSKFNEDINSPAYVGYMHNTVYTYSSRAIINSSKYFSGTKAYGDGATYASSKYTLTNATTLDVTSSNISTLVGKYTCNSSSTTGTCSSLWYIVGYSRTTIYYYSLSGGTTDGTTLANKDYVFGSSFTYANGTYTLSDTVTLNSDTFITNKSNVDTHHYTCLSSGTTCSSVYYVYYINNGITYYITLTGGKSVSDALNEMLYANDVNKNDSTIKAYIDNWYENNLASYEDKLEDTVFCNDRSMSNESSNGWNPNGGSTSTTLQFKNDSISNKSLVCANETDSFSMSNVKAKLKHPIGLLSSPEIRLASYGSSHYFNNGQNGWLASPYYFNSSYALGGVVGTSGWGDGFVNDSRGVRPSVSIKPGTSFSSGDGSYTSPFVIE